MKTRYIIMAAMTALAVLSGCAKEQEVAVPGKHHFRAAIEQSADTRVSVANDGKATWVAGDEIAVYIGSGFETIEIENPATGDFTIDPSLNPEDRGYYAVYPANIATGTSSSAPLQLTLPATYSLEGKSADYSPVPMIAVNDPDQDILYFRHVGGLLRIICNDVPAGTTTATVTFDKDVTGVYTVNTSDPTAPTISNRGEATANTVTFKDISGSSIILNVPVPCGTYASVTVAFNDPDNHTKTYNCPMTFARQHAKVLLDGEGVYEFVLGNLSDVITESTGGIKHLSTDFVSYKTDGSVRAVVPFVLEYSDNGVDGWTTDAPAWLTADSRIDYSGYTSGHVLDIAIANQLNSAKDTHAQNLRKDESDWADNVDLSLINVATGLPTAGSTTANCYVVQAPGTYRFPAVYGNALADGGVNRDAFVAKDENGDDRVNPGEEDWYYRYFDPDHAAFRYGYLGSFLDHKNNLITSPYIATQTGASTLRAELLWTDEPNLVTDVRIDPATSGEGTYITFNVPVETICQGNALIGIIADGEIAWSWHIWVTDEDLTVQKTGPSGDQFSPVNIGWCDTKDLVRYDERTIHARVRQEEDNGLTSAPVTIKSKAGEITILGGNSPNYQWGRKDPLPTGYLLTTGSSSTPMEKVYFPAKPEYQTTEHIFFLADIEFGTVIQHPFITYYNNNPTLVRYGWCNSFFLNLWNSHAYATERGENDENFQIPVTKTIYDPSPVGYKIPHMGAFADLNDSNFIWAQEEGCAGRSFGTAPNNLFIPLLSYRDRYYEIRQASISYWSANLSHRFHEVTSYGLSFSADGVSQISYSFLTTGLPVRPITED